MKMIPPDIVLCSFVVWQMDTLLGRIPTARTIYFLVDATLELYLSLIALENPQLFFNLKAENTYTRWHR